MDEKGVTQTADLLHRLCPICGEDNENEKALNPGTNWSLKKCVQCELVYIEDVPQYQKLQESFSWQKSWRKEKRKRQQEEKTLHK